MMQTVGHKNALEMMEKEDPLFLLAFLPVIPFGLILGRMVKWEDYLYNYGESIPVNCGMPLAGKKMKVILSTLLEFLQSQVMVWILVMQQEFFVVP